MRYDIHFRQEVITRMKEVVEDIRVWQHESRIERSELDQLIERVVCFGHCPVPEHDFTVAGSDSSGEFPVVSYGDSHIYLVTAKTKLFSSGDRNPRELDVGGLDIYDFLWLPEDEDIRNHKYNQFFERISGIPLLQLCTQSDYLQLRRKSGGPRTTPSELIQLIVRPPAHDASNIRIHIMTAAELCTTAQLLRSELTPTYVLADTTLTLPLVKQKGCLFFELVKRYCCQLALEKGTAFLAISKSHNLPHMDQLDDLITETYGAEHWYLRIPDAQTDNFKPQFLGARGIPPVGAVTYVFRFHKTTPPMRLDMDRTYWEQNVHCSDPEIEKQKESRIFRDLDYISHDQRCYGYPYPIKASHDAVSLTTAEKEAMRKQVIEMGERNGLKRFNFTDVSIFTGHR